jgi:putative acetyltransferase
VTAAGSIRRARAAEHPALVALWERSVRATHDFLSEADIEELRPRVVEALAWPGLELWVLTGGDDRPIGFLGLAGDDIAALFVDADDRGRGVGSRLVGHAQTLRGGSLTVDVNEQNPTAVGFYEALGFAVTGRSPHDGDGRPFPLLHMRRPPPAAALRLRVARHTDRLADIVAFYRDGLGLPEIGRFAGHAGYDGVFLAVPGTGAHLEFTTGGGHAAPVPHPESLLVLYLGSRAAVDAVVARLGGETVAPANPYWEAHAQTVADPDGFRVVLVPEPWPGDDPPPAADPRVRR